MIIIFYSIKILSSLFIFLSLCKITNSGPQIQDGGGTSQLRPTHAPGNINYGLQKKEIIETVQHVTNSGMLTAGPININMLSLSNVEC